MSLADVNLVLVAQHLRDHYRYLAEAGALDLFELGPYLCLRSKDPRYACNFVVGCPSTHDAGAHIDALGLYAASRPTQSLVWFADGQDRHLIHKLSQHGLQHAADLTEVAIDLRDQGVQARLAQLRKPQTRFVIEAVANKEDYQAWCEVHALTWGRTMDEATYLFQAAHNPKRARGRIELYLVRLGTKVVACTMLDIQGTSAGCYRTAVLPEFRGQGIARLILQARLQMAQEHACRLVVGQCSASSLALYRQFGFALGGSLALLRRQP